MSSPLSEAPQTPEEESVGHQGLTFAEAVGKGNRMLARLEHQPEGPRQRPIMNRNELLQAGWTIQEDSALDWSGDAMLGSIIGFLREDLDFYHFRGRLVHVFDEEGSATFSNLFCPDGTLLAINNIKWSTAPPYWSDIVWAIADHLGFPITEVWRCHIMNEDTRDTMEQVLHRPNSLRLFEFPCNQAAALLGTPNGHGVGWLMADHRHLFERQILQDVLAIRGSDDTHYYLRFRIGPKPDIP